MTEQALFILAALSDGERHGYAIAAEAQELSGGGIRLTAGTLYGALNRLSREGLIEEAREEVVDGRRRRYYRLTGSGRIQLTAEVERLRAAASVIEQRISVRRKPGPGLA